MAYLYYSALAGLISKFGMAFEMSTSKQGDYENLELVISGYSIDLI